MTHVPASLKEKWLVTPSAMTLDIAVAMEALYDNAIDGRYADRCMGSDFDAAYRRLRRSFVQFLAGAL